MALPIRYSSFRKYVLIGAAGPALALSGCASSGKLSKADKRGELRLLTRRELRAAIAAGQVGPDTLYFNNTVTTKGELDDHWPAPAGQTWLSGYFNG